jgi:Rps23 Pro-64 3,4-dihydroxylase Tpa1-like proline 4-hydroxylase
MKVTLLLQGGFQLGVDVGQDRFDEILATLAPGDRSRRPTLLHLNTGDDTVTVPSDRIVAVRSAGVMVRAQAGVRPAVGAAAGASFRFVGGEPVAYSPGRSRYPSPALVADGFLTRDENSALLRLAIDRQREFVPSRTATNAVGYRVSHVLFRPRAAETLMRSRIARVLPDIISRFKFRNFRPGPIEVQLTAHNDGNYYRIHNDNGSGSGNTVSAGRVLTFVYYFCRVPRRFRGGGLRLYESVARNGYWTAGRAATEIAPENNRMVFFPARYHHEVLPVVCPSHRFEDGRFTINGWIHRAPATMRT